MATQQRFSGYDVPQAWGRSANYQGGQGGQLVTHAMVTWRALKPQNGVPPGTISGQWERVPDTITSPNQAAPAPTPAPTPTPKPTPFPYPPISATYPIQVNGTRISVKALTKSGATHSPGYAPDTPSIAGTTKFLREDATWAVPGGGGGGTVTSVALALPASVFSVSGSPIVGAGTLTGAFATQAANLVWSGPASGAAATPTFRAIVPADLAGTPGAGKYWDGTGTWTTLPAPGTGTVTSIAIAAPTEINVAGSPVTTAGTITLSWNSEAQHSVFAGPSGGAGTPAFRALVASDIPALSYVTSVALTAPTEITVGGSPITSAGTLALSWASAAQHAFFAGPSGSSGTPSFRAMVASDLPSTAVTPGAYTYASVTVDQQGRLTSAASGAAPTGTVTSVAMTVPSFLSVAGSPVTTSGTLAVTLATETANQMFAGPASGGAATPTFRSMVAADIPNTAVTPGSYTHTALTVDAQGRITAASSGTVTTGTVTSVALTAPTEITVGGSPVTTAGTLALSWASAAQHAVFAGPSGSSGAPAFRALIASDIPALSYVTSVALTVPSILSVSGSPITTSGTLAVTLANESANLVFAGPSSGAATTPTFRAIVPLDLATGGTATKFYRGDGVFATVPGASLPPTVNSAAIIYAYNILF